MSKYVLVFRFETETDAVAEAFATSVAPVVAQVAAESVHKDNILNVQVALSKLEEQDAGE